ncbi:MAG: hypothetical protein JNJ89_13395 [Rubrivivax sp.]|nr:hypothetical protein [Rubrivivax sp.]
MAPEIRQFVLERLNAPVSLALASMADKLDHAIASAYPTAAGPHPLVLEQPSAHASDGGALHWTVHFQRDGLALPLAVTSDLRPTDLEGFRRWDIYVSTRVPLITTVQRTCKGGIWEQGSEADPELQRLAFMLAGAFALEVIDYSEICALRVDPALITDEMRMRLDHSDDPTVFQLLFSEDA